MGIAFLYTISSSYFLGWEAAVLDAMFMVPSARNVNV